MQNMNNKCYNNNMIDNHIKAKLIYYNFKPEAFILESTRKNRIIYPLHILPYGCWTCGDLHKEDYIYSVRKWEPYYKYEYWGSVHICKLCYERFEYLYDEINSI